MNNNRPLRALVVYLTLGLPLAASCARGTNNLEGDFDESSSGSSTAGSATTPGASGSATEPAGMNQSGSSGQGVPSAFGGTATSGGQSSGGKGGSSSTSGGSGGASAGRGGAGGTGGTGGTGGAAGVPADVLARASAVVYYQTTHATAMDKMIQMKLNIRNQSADPLPMSDVKIRYWFTAEATPELHQYYTGAQAKGPKAVFVSDGKNSHVLMTFSGGTITKGGDDNQSEVQLEIDNNTTPFDQSDDFSWNAAAKTSTPNDKITLYLDDQLIWGCEPSGDCFGDSGNGSAGAGSGGGAGNGGSAGTAATAGTSSSAGASGSGGDTSAGGTTSAGGSAGTGGT